MRSFRIITMATIFYLLTGAASGAAGSPNFSGHWVLDPGASKLSYKPETSQTMDITQKDSTLIVVATTGNVKETHKYALDGSTTKENVEGMMTVEICAKWQGSSLELTTSAGGTKSSQTWQLVDNGKTLEIDSTSMRSRKEQYMYRKN